LTSLLSVITAADPTVRDQSLDALCRHATLPELLQQCDELDRFRRAS